PALARIPEEVRRGVRDGVAPAIDHVDAVARRHDDGVADRLRHRGGEDLPRLGTGRGGGRGRGRRRGFRRDRRVSIAATGRQEGNDRGAQAGLQDSTPGERALDEVAQGGIERGIDGTIVLDRHTWLAPWLGGNDHGETRWRP